MICGEGQREGEERREMTQKEKIWGMEEGEKEEKEEKEVGGSGGRGEWDHSET